MTDARMALLELIEKRADTDLVREMLAFAAERLMDLEVETLTGAPAGVRSPERLNQRNGYRERAWDTRAGRIDLAIPKLRKGSLISTGSRPGPWTTSSRPWAHPASPKAKSRACARRSMSG
jgi:putative transposase